MSTERLLSSETTTLTSTLPFLIPNLSWRSVSVTSLGLPRYQFARMKLAFGTKDLNFSFHCCKPTGCRNPSADPQPHPHNNNHHPKTKNQGPLTTLTLRLSLGLYRVATGPRLTHYHGQTGKNLSSLKGNWIWVVLLEAMKMDRWVGTPSLVNKAMISSDSKNFSRLFWQFLSSRKLPNITPVHKTEALLQSNIEILSILISGVSIPCDLHTTREPYY